MKFINIADTVKKYLSIGTLHCKKDTGYTELDTKEVLNRFLTPLTPTSSFFEEASH